MRIQLMQMNKKSRMLIASLGIGLASLLVFLYVSASPPPASSAQSTPAMTALVSSVPPTGSSVSPIARSTYGLPDFSEIVEKTSPAVVHIRTTTTISGDARIEELLRDFFLPNLPSPRSRGKRSQEEEMQPGIGSGFITSSDGYIMTSMHVIENASDIHVILKDKRKFKAKLIGADKRTDVAILKIEGSRFPFLTLGNSSKIKVGQWVVAIGSPFGLDNTVTSGIVSAKTRDTGDYLPLIQTDVAVNPGNSGGPLLNMQGEVIGINAQIYSRSGGFMGISFAIPIDEAMHVANQLKTTGKVTRGRIGISIYAVQKDVAQSLGLPSNQGAQVTSIETDGPAAKAGILVGDIIIKFNQVNIDKAKDLPLLVGNMKPGTKAVVTVWRKGKIKNIPVTVMQSEDDNLLAKADKENNNPAVNAFGLVVADLTHKQLKENGIDHGIIVIGDPSGRAQEVGIRRGDIIQRLNNDDIESAEQFNKIVNELDTKKSVALLVKRSDISVFVFLGGEE